MLSRSVDELLGTITLGRGVARNNQYRVIISPPILQDLTGVASLAFDMFAMKTIDTLCDSVTMPGRNISTTEYTVGAQTLKTPYTFINSEVSASFILTNDGLVREFFEAWMNNIFDPKNYVAYYKEQYTSDIIISQVDQNGIPVYTVKLENAYPTNINEYTLSNAEENSATRIEVTFAYDNYVRLFGE